MLGAVATRQTAKLEALQQRIDRHTFHIDSLEKILRMLDNESLEPEQVRGAASGSGRGGTSRRVG